MNKGDIVRELKTGGHWYCTSMPEKQYGVWRIFNLQGEGRTLRHGDINNYNVEATNCVGGDLNMYKQDKSKPTIEQCMESYNDLDRMFDRLSELYTIQKALTVKLTEELAGVKIDLADYETKVRHGRLQTWEEWEIANAERGMH